jgi:hypothetical protein
MTEDDLPVFNLDYEKVEALSNPDSNVGDLAGLQEWFVARAARAGQVLPFPPDLVCGITDAQVSALLAVFGIREADRYNYWEYVYDWALFRYVEDDLTDEAAVMQQRVREVVPTWHLPEVFFLLATSRYRKEKAERELPDKKRGMWARANRRAQDNAKKLAAVIRQLEKVLSLMDESAEDGRMRRLSLPRGVKSTISEKNWLSYRPLSTKISKRARSCSQRCTRMSKRTCREKSSKTCPTVSTKRSIGWPQFWQKQKAQRQRRLALLFNCLASGI